MAAKVYGERWETIEPLGEGGQAHTYHVRDLTGDYGDNAVLKRLKNPNRHARFRDEIRAIQKLDHPNIVRMWDFSLDGEPFYLVSEYCLGGHLNAPLIRRERDYLSALELFLEIVEGVAAIHNEKIVHRDLKPENVLLQTVVGPAVIADFGLCYIDEGERNTLSMEPVGARWYMAPEFEDGRAENITPASDIYSLGKVLYFLLSGGKMFSREKHREPSWDLVKLRNDIRLEHVNRLLDKMIVANPAHRLNDATALIPEVATILRLFRHDYNVISPDIPQPCLYCGRGTYSVKAMNNTDDARNFSGIGGGGRPGWTVLMCDQCGHVQFFRTDLSARKDWWGLKET